MDRSSGQKIDKETLVLNDTADQLDLINKKKENCIQQQQNMHSFQVQDRSHDRSQSKSQ